MQTRLSLLSCSGTKGETQESDAVTVQPASSEFGERPAVQDPALEPRAGSWDGDLYVDSISHTCVDHFMSLVRLRRNSRLSSQPRTGLLSLSNMC
jgi:hypothetical protein